MLDEFRSFAAVLKGAPRRLRRAGADESVILALHLCGTAVSVALREAVTSGPILGSSSAVLDYLRFSLASSTSEEFRTLFLNARNELLADETTSVGTVDAAPFYPRAIIGRAIELGATSLIVAHNHPSGDPSPSSADLACTMALANLCAGLDITLLDHVVVARGAATSMRAAGLLAR